MQSVRSTLEKSPFSFMYPNRQARILDGEDEGSFGWVTANYLSGALKVGQSSKLCVECEYEPDERV